MSRKEIEMRICVFCGSNPAIGNPYTEAARELGSALGSGGHTLVFGGFEMGLMGEVSRAAKAAGATVIGVIPKVLEGGPGRKVFPCDELVETDDLEQRKHVMEEHSDAFVCLPGAYGTLDEAYEVLALQKAAAGHPAPVAFVNTAGFYDALSALHDRMLQEGFMSQEDYGYAFFAPDGPAALAWIEEQLA